MTRYVRVESDHLTLGPERLKKGQIIEAERFGLPTAKELVARGRLAEVTEAKAEKKVSDG
jgi:hypothetical protein